MQDYQGKVVFAYYKGFSELEVLLTEVMTLLASLKICVNQNFNSLIVESDSKVIIQLVRFDVLSK